MRVTRLLQGHRRGNLFKLARISGMRLEIVLILVLAIIGFRVDGRKKFMSFKLLNIVRHLRISRLTIYYPAVIIEKLSIFEHRTLSI